MNDYHTRKAVSEAIDAFAGKLHWEQINSVIAAVDDGRVLDADHVAGAGKPIDATQTPDYKAAWEALSKPLSWMHDNARLKPYWGWNLAAIANDLIDNAYPGLRSGEIVGTTETTANPVDALIAWARDNQAFPVGNAGGEGRGHIDENARFRLRDMITAIDASEQQAVPVAQEWLTVANFLNNQGFDLAASAVTREARGRLASLPCKSGEGSGEELAGRREVNTILSGLMQQLQPDCPDMVERIRLGNEACTAILALRTDPTQTREAELVAALAVARKALEPLVQAPVRDGPNGRHSIARNAIHKIDAALNARGGA